jgi:hypothetical protein
MSTKAVKRLTAEQVEELGFMPDVALALEANRAVSQALGQQIETLEKRLKERVRLREEFKLLKTAPGIGEILATTIMLETGTLERFAKVGNFSSYCRCVDSLRESNDKKKGEGNAKNGNKYLAWAFVEAANFARRYCPPAKSFYERKKAQGQRHPGDQGSGAQVGAGVLPHAARAETLRCESLFRVTVWPKAVSQESGLVCNQWSDLDAAFAPPDGVQIAESPKP